MRRRVLAVVVASSAALVALAAVSCGLDVVGEFERPTPIDAGRTIEASLPPSLDAAIDAGGDAGACPPDASFASDPANCGRCGRSCFGAACVAGSCTPEVFATGDGGAVGLAMDDAGVYVAAFNSGNVLKLDRTTGADAGLLATAQAAPNEVFVHEGQVYWTNYADPGGAVMTCPTSGCALPTAVAPLVALPVYPWVDGTQLYFTSYSGNDVERCTLPGCLDRAPIGTVPGAHTMFVADGRVWVTGYIGTGSLASMQIDGGDPFIHRSNAPNARGVFVTATDLWMTIEGDDAVLRCPKTGTCDGVAPFAFGVGPVTVAVDGGYVYWTNYANAAAGTGSVARCPVTGCTTGGAEYIAIAQDGPWALAFDDRWVYWTNYSASSAMVMRVAK
jgi:hypothetical protein